MKAPAQVRMRYSWIGLLVVLCFFAAPAPGAFSAEKQKPKGLPTDKMLKSDSPLHIASDRMEVKQLDRTLVFEGHVVVQQDDMTITGNRLKVAAIQGDKSSQTAMVDKIDRIEMEGDVKISQKDKIAVAEKAVYYHQEKKIVLMGNPSVSQGKDMVKGRLITLYIDEGRSVIEGGEENPVHAVLHPARKE